MGFYRGQLLALAVLALAASPPAAQALENGVGRTPMMGWMAWIRFRCNIACDADPCAAPPAPPPLPTPDRVCRRPTE